MTEADADKLFEEVEQLMANKNAVVDTLCYVYRTLRAYPKIVEAATTYLKCECYQKAGDSCETAGIIDKFWRSYKRSAIHFELAGSCMRSCHSPHYLTLYNWAFEMYSKTNDVDGLERCSAIILLNWNPTVLSRTFSSKYYQKKLEKLIKYSQKHGHIKLLKSLKYKYLKYLYKENGTKEAFQFFDEVITNDRGSYPCQDLIELRCVCVCVIAILRKEAEVETENAEVCDVPQESEQISKHLTVKKLWECLRFRNIDSLEEAVKGMSTKSENTENAIEDTGTVEIKDSNNCTSELE